MVKINPTNLGKVSLWRGRLKVSRPTVVSNSVQHRAAQVHQHSPSNTPPFVADTMKASIKEDKSRHATTHSRRLLVDSLALVSVQCGLVLMYHKAIILPRLIGT